MKVLSHFWSGAVRWGSGCDLWAVARKSGGWKSLETGGLDALVGGGVPLKTAREWMRTPRISTMGRAIAMCSDEYPGRLKDYPWAPPVLFVQGDASCFRRPAMAVVGTRQCTAYGAGVSRRLAGGLAAGGFVVVSGLARGIDGHAHRATLTVGQTIAVLAHGLSYTSPRTHCRLRDAILRQGGMMVSVWPDDVPPRPYRFPLRNRWIAGLSDQTLVVEAPLRSGALITANVANEMGRDVWAVPGPLSSDTSRGCNRLISQGAGVVWDAEECLAHWLGVRRAPLTQWVSWLMDGVPLEDVAKRSGRSVTDLLTELTQMEVAGEVIRLPGQRYVPGRLLA